MTIKASPAKINRAKDQSRMTIKASPAKLNRDKDQSTRLYKNESLQSTRL